jgi:hypothetical protein
VALNKAELTYQATAESWPRKLLVTQVQHDIIKANALKDGVSRQFFKDWAEKYLSIMEVKDGADG